MTPEQRSKIHTMKANGHSLSEIAEAVGRSIATVRRVLAEPESAPAQPAPDNSTHPTPSLGSRLTMLGAELSAAGMSDESAIVFEAAARLSALEALSEPDDLDDDTELPTEPVDVLRAAMLSSQRQAHAWESVGNASGASRALRTAALIAPALAKLEKARRDDRGGFHVSNAELAEAQRDRDKHKAALACFRGYCNGCSREIRVAEVFDRAPDFANPARGPILNPDGTAQIGLADVMAWGVTGKEGTNGQ